MLLDEEHPVDADRLLVVTFSNAAAREMRQRIDARLAQEQAARPYSQHLRRQRFLMERAHISTIPCLLFGSDQPSHGGIRFASGFYSGGGGTLVSDSPGSSGAGD